MVSVLCSNAGEEFHEILVNELPIVYWVNYVSSGDTAFIYIMV